jgi:purine-binding chemotaxis protein CheW
MSENTEKFLVFNIAEEAYGIPITKVREVIRHEKITSVHETSSYLKGVINLRGKIIPIIDMRSKFGMHATEYTDRTVFIIVDVAGAKDNYNFGIAVDAVQDVVDLPENAIDQVPDVGLKLKSGYLHGIAKSGGNMLMVLNIDKILSTEEIVDLNGLEASVSA